MGSGSKAPSERAVGEEARDEGPEVRPGDELRELGALETGDLPRDPGVVDCDFDMLLNFEAAPNSENPPREPHEGGK